MAVTKKPQVPMAGSRMTSFSDGSTIRTIMWHMLRGVKNWPLSPRRLEPTIVSYAWPLTSTSLSSREYICSCATM